MGEHWRLAAALILAGWVVAAPAQSDDLIPALERSAGTENAEAIYHLGMAYQTGSGVQPNRQKALDAFRRSAALGDPLGAYKLGCYYSGQGQGLIQDDPDLALRYKLVAAEAGYALAQHDVAALYMRRGEPALAMTWLGKAAAQGVGSSLLAYAKVHNGAPGVARDPAVTAAYYRLYLDRTQANDEQRAQVASFEQGLTATERKKATEIARAFRPAPTALTLKARSGVRAARALVARKSGRLAVE